MGDSYSVESIEVLYGGLLQFDIKNDNTGEYVRFFCNSSKILNAIGNTMDANYLNTIANMNKEQQPNA